MHKHPDLTRDRVKQFLQRELKDRTILKTAPVQAEFQAGEGWTPIERGFRWGPAYASGAYRVRFQIPKDWIGTEVVLFYGEPTYWGTKDGTVEATVFRQGEAIGALDFAHPFLRLADKAEGREKFELVLQTYAHNAETTVHGMEKPRTPEPEEFRGFSLGQIDSELVGLAYDVQFALGLYETLPEGDPARAIVLRALNGVCNHYRAGASKTVSACRRIVRSACDSLNQETHHEIVPVGHAHLDTAWLWPLSVTRLKMAHTTAAQLALMDRYPEHVFVHSQASQYEWLEQEHPKLLERVKRAVRAGQWEVLGSMWVEADCNLTGGESLVRQFLYGKRYFKQQFGVDTIDMWLPDVFGYSAALPQILTKFGIKVFLTQKLSWNQFNKIPHHTFWWQGIDGSRVWTHFPPADTYCAMCEPKEIAESVKKYKDAGRSDSSLYVFGFGDGGGGPTEQHIEHLRRARNAPGLPAVAVKKKAKDFFVQAMAESRDLCTWVGELYFELHRGTYTSQAANKRSNRECEFLLRDAEWLASFCQERDGYPRQQLEEAWKLVLLNQFHDIIPGSSVREVYQDSKVDYARVRQLGTGVIDHCLDAMGKRLDTSHATAPIAVFHNSDIVSQGEIPWDKPTAPRSLAVGQETLPVQLVDEWGDRKLVFPTPVDALGAVAVGDLGDAAPFAVPRLKVSGRRIENGEFAIKFDNHGNITSIQTLDDDPIEFIRPGKLGNLFQLFDDHPLFWDAWDVDLFALETQRDMVKAQSFEIVERGPVRVAVETCRTFGSSMIRQRISLGPTPGIRFDTLVDWHEEDTLLKVAFPLNVNTQRATFDIQFGNVERPTHRNTSWDLARFEVCAQKWADMSEGGHGAALINTGKYGYDCLDDTLRLTLLRSPKAPDPTCDMGQHRFTYVLLPHYDQVQHSDVVAAAYAINAPVRTRQLKPSTGHKAELPPFVSCDDRNLVVETVKRAEDSDLTVLRLYECHNARGRASVRCCVAAKRAWLADLNENKVEGLEVVDGAINFTFKPFEIITMLVEF